VRVSGDRERRGAGKSSWLAARRKVRRNRANGRRIKPAEG